MDLNRPIQLNKLTILNWNADGIKRQKVAFQYFLIHNNIDIACISETHLIPGESFKITNYNIYRYDRTICTIASGGAAVLVKKNISQEQIILPPLQKFEAVGVKIYLQDNNYLKNFAAYLPPNKQIVIGDINKIFDTDRHPTILAGDLNSKHPAWYSRVANPNGRKLFEFMN